MRASLLLTVLFLHRGVHAAAIDHAQYLESRPYLLPRVNGDPGDPVPEQDQINQTLQFPDGHYACQIWLTGGTPGQDQCMKHCGDVRQQADDTGNPASILCVGVDYAYGPMQGQLITSNDGTYVLGKCICDCPLVDTIVQNVVLALPIIASIGCEILFQAFDVILEIGAMAIPGVGELDVGMRML